jgi:hypothetical protein
MVVGGLGGSLGHRGGLVRGLLLLLFRMCRPSEELVWDQLSVYECVRTVTIITFDRIIRSDVLRAPSKYHFRTARTRSHGAYRMTVQACGMDEMPSRRPWAMIGMGMLAER